MDDVSITKIIKWILLQMLHFWNINNWIDYFICSALFFFCTYSSKLIFVEM
jgi:hypothetical protein